MKTAIVTGASSGIGLSVSRLLHEEAYKVFGLARRFSGQMSPGGIMEMRCDISNEKELRETAESIVARTESLDLLVNNAGIGIFGPHEDLRPEDLSRMLRTNFVAPILLTRYCLKALKKSKGMIINIASTAALKTGPMGSAYAATKAGLRHFGASLFEEVRKAGVRVVTINPDMADTAFYENAHFGAHEDKDSSLMAEDIAKAVKMVLDQREGSLISELTVKPQRMQIKKK